MIRTQISLTKGQHEYLKERTRLTGESLSSMIRRALEHLRQLEPVERPAALVRDRVRDELGRETPVG
jgi:hypothetical protein